MDIELENTPDEYYSTLAVEYVARELPIPDVIASKLSEEVLEILAELQEQIKRDRPNVKTNIIGESVVSA